MAKRIDRTLVRLGLRVAIGFGALMLVFVGLATWSAYQKDRISQVELEAGVAEHDDLVVREATLKKELGALDTDRGVEAAIRGRYLVAKPGEELVTLIQPHIATSTASEGERGIWGSIKHWLRW